jgi:hypothetical protein
MTWEPVSEARLLADIEAAELAMELRLLAVWNMVCIRPVNRALKQSHFRGMKGGHRELPGEAGRA